MTPKWLIRLLLYFCAIFQIFWKRTKALCEEQTKMQSFVYGKDILKIIFDAWKKENQFMHFIHISPSYGFRRLIKMKNILK